MSDPIEIGLDLEKHFLPAWAQRPADTKAYDKYEGEPDRRRHEDRGDRPDRGDRRRAPDSRQGGGDRRGPRPERRGFGRPAGGPPGGLKWEGGPAPRRQEFRREEPRDTLPDVEVVIRPDPGGAASLARQIKLSGRAYPLFEVAGLVVQKPDRYEITFRTVRRKDGTVANRLFECSLDGSIWLSEEEAVRHVLRHHFDTFYQTEKLPCDPPKGVWTLVAQFDEIILGPPNYHGYQERLREVHAQRAPRLPFDVFKSKVRMVKDEAAVKQWIEGQSSRLEYTTLNVPE